MEVVAMSATVTQTGGDRVVRVVTGRAGHEEVAAVVALLLARVTEAVRQESGPAARGTRRRRPAGFLPAHSWQAR
jgi:Acyl-CoA carboxylase epsilon subunit